MAGINERSPRVWLASESELDAVAALIAEFRDHWGRSDPPVEAIRESAARILAGNDGEYLLGGVGGGEPTGFAQLRFRWSVWVSAEDCWLEDLFVCGEARGAGLGRALVEASCERARARGCERIELDTTEDNVAALALYEACGFSANPKAAGSRSLLLGRDLR
jgi:GNAT superfamily N-acetyltransferase